MRDEITSMTFVPHRFRKFSANFRRWACCHIVELTKMTKIGMRDEMTPMTPMPDESKH